MFKPLFPLNGLFLETSNILSISDHIDCFAAIMCQKKLLKNSATCETWKKWCSFASIKVVLSSLSNSTFRAGI